MIVEETPRMFAVFVWKENSNTVLLVGYLIAIVSPDNTQEQRASRSHNGDIWQEPTAVISW
jgi:hypothetical protein